MLAGERERLLEQHVPRAVALRAPRNMCRLKSGKTRWARGAARASRSLPPGDDGVTQQSSLSPCRVHFWPLEAKGPRRRNRRGPLQLNVFPVAAAVWVQQLSRPPRSTAPAPLRARVYRVYGLTANWLLLLLLRLVPESTLPPPERVLRSSVRIARSWPAARGSSRWSSVDPRARMATASDSAATLLWKN